MLSRAAAVPAAVDLFDALRPEVEARTDDSPDVRLFRMFDMLSADELAQLDGAQGEAFASPRASALRALSPAARKRELFLSMLHMAEMEERPFAAAADDDDDDDDDDSASAFDAALEARGVGLLPLPPCAEEWPPFAPGAPLEASARLRAALSRPHLAVAASVARSARAVARRMRSTGGAWGGGAARELSARLWCAAAAPPAARRPPPLTLFSPPAARGCCVGRRTSRRSRRLLDATGVMLGLLLFTSEDDSWIEETSTYKDWKVFHAFFKSVSITWQHLLAQPDETIGLCSLPADLTLSPSANDPSRPSPFCAFALSRSTDSSDTAAAQAPPALPSSARTQLHAALHAWEERTNMFLSKYDKYASRAVGKARLEVFPRENTQGNKASPERSTKTAPGTRLCKRQSSVVVEATYAY
ncbi:hypothetical protein AB1Y20_002387 [Prymnesium parvum]|uniref:Uncharacterized protein n=1 Tax=Prymnesium parvum TaxID=97485 RepID=A0AB34J969_PRYPA